jgi:uncharacterized protein
MQALLSYNRANAHVVRFGGRAMLLHVPTTALFELDELGRAVLDAVEGGAVDVSELDRDLAPRHGSEQVRAFVDELERLEVLQPADALVTLNPRKPDVQRYPLSTVVLNVNTGCNLGCTYCYKEDLQVPARGKRMDFATASRSVDFLLQQAGEREAVTVVFFGGEPLTNLALIREVVAYARRQAGEAGKRVEFSLTTNATLLDEATIDWLDAQGFGIAVSMDGPKLVHDRHRRTVGGRGTYDVVARKVRLLLDRYRARPVGARVTLSGGTTEVEAIHAHLRGELGFHEVGYAPVTAAEDAKHALGADELLEVHAAFERLGEDYLRHALRNASNGFSNMHQLMTDLHQGRRKSLPCGAGVGMLAVDHEGGLNLCHRFTGSTLPTFGNVNSGIDGERLGGFLARAADREGTGCATCRIRNLCSGGCYHEAYARYGDPLHRTYHYCDLLRRWVDFGVRVYGEIQAQRPDFFATHIDTRRALS